MMDFQISETEKMIRDTVRDYAQKTLKKDATELDAKEEFPFEHLKELAEMGLMAVNVPEKFGGAEAGSVALSLALTEVAAGCASTAVCMSVTNMVAEIINLFGSEEQKKNYIPKLASGEYVSGSFSLTEPQAGSDAKALQTKAVKDGNEYVINGSKLFVTSGEFSGVVIVYALTGKKKDRPEISAFIVEKDTPGMKVDKREEKLGLLASNTVSLAFDDCRIPAQNLLSKEGDGFKIAMTALDGGRIGIASQAVGIARQAYETAKQYAKERQQFGQAIENFQGIRWKLADMIKEIEAARLMTLRAAWLKGQGKRFTKEASMAKLYSTEIANRIALDALQVHGGYGFIKEYPVERFVRDVRATTIYEGTSEVQRMVIARELLK